MKEYALDLAKRAKEASATLVLAGGAQKNAWLKASARLLREHCDTLLAANRKDLDAAHDLGLTVAQTDRLQLSKQRVEEMARGLEEIAALPDPIGRIISSEIRPNGLEIRKIRVPLGVVFFIYESRPNVTADAAAICIKSGNAVILRGGKEAINSNKAIEEILSIAAEQNGISRNAVQLVETSDREVITELLELPEYITVAIPRGGPGLIKTVTDKAKMPVIKHFAGNCHVYIDKYADPDVAEKVLLNSKCHRLGVCNAAESLIVHKDVAESLLPRLAGALIDNGIEIRGDETTCKIVTESKPATDEDYYTEFLGSKISVKVVDSLDAAIRWINDHSDGHTEAIVTKDLAAAREFTARIDSSAVMVNASTRFNDGGCFGLGAEIGISTDKFHARGPCGLEELTSYKYIVYGNGHTRD